MPRRGKKTDRKQPLAGDIDIEAAPDAAPEAIDKALQKETPEESLLEDEQDQQNPDIVFDCTSDTTIPYVETDLNVSARTKLSNPSL